MRTKVWLRFPIKKYKITVRFAGEFASAVYEEFKGQSYDNTYNA